VEHWNSLPERARTANSQHAFKAMLKNIRMYAARNCPGHSHYYSPDNRNEKQKHITGGKPKSESKKETGRKKGWPHGRQYVSITLLYGDLDTPSQVFQVIKVREKDHKLQLPCFYSD
jgi:hypothetical protein